MSISSINGSHGVSVESSNHSSSDGYEKAIQALEKQKEMISKQISDINNNQKMDSKSKKIAVSSLQQQINEIDSQISQMKSDEMTQKIKKEKPSSKSSQNNIENNIKTSDSKNSTDFVELSNDFSAISQVKDFKNMINHAKTRINILSYEMSKSGATEFKMNEMTNLKERISSLGKTIEKKISGIDKHYKASDSNKIARNPKISGYDKDGNIISAKLDDSDNQGEEGSTISKTA